MLKGESDNGISQLLVGIKGNMETTFEYSGRLKLSVETSHQVSSSTNIVTLFHYLHVKLSTELSNGLRLTLLAVYTNSYDTSVGS